jgi:hypothetical protein
MLGEIGWSQEDGISSKLKFLGMIRNYHLFSDFEAPENPWTHFLWFFCSSELMPDQASPFTSRAQDA